MEGDRRDDWKTGVDRQLVALTTAQRVIDDQLDDLEIQCNVLDKALRGDPGAETSGLIGRLEETEDRVAELRAAVFMDATGKRGLAHDVDVLMGRKADREKPIGYRWQVWVPILAALIMAAVAIITNKDKIALWFPKKPLSPWEQMLERAKHPKNRYHHYTIHVGAEDQE